MSIIIVQGRIVVTPAQAEGFAVTARQAVALALLEPGNIVYRISRDVNDQGVFFLYEEWTGPEAFAAHVASPGAQALAANAQALGIVGFTQEIYSAEGVPVPHDG